MPETLSPVVSVTPPAPGAAAAVPAAGAPLRAPLRFEPLFMERVWGGRHLETLFGKKLPPNARIGESWELVDREEAQSVVHDGPLRGQTLHELWTGPRREEIFGPGWPDSPRFPLLVKILDAQDRLSIQVHPPESVAAELHGEPKTEMWYLAHAEPTAELYAGLEDDGVTRERFAAALEKGDAAALVHRLPVRAGDAMFIPSGRLHAIGTGNVIIEIQQNSDTTYRVFDWNRVGLDGKLRTLHVAESLCAIDFQDVRPGLQPAPEAARGVVAECPYFRVEKWNLSEARTALADTGERGAIFTCLSGALECMGERFRPGDFFLVPAVLADAASLTPKSPDTAVLRTTVP